MTMRRTWIVMVLVTFVGMSDHCEDAEEKARTFMDDLNKRYKIMSNIAVNAAWDYESNMTDYNSEKKENISAEQSIIFKQNWEKVNSFDWKNFKDPVLKRMFESISEPGDTVLTDEEREKLGGLIDDMSKYYSTTKLIEWRDPKNKTQIVPKEPTIMMEPDLFNMFSSDGNQTCKLKYYWEGWFSTVGRSVKSMYKEYVDLSNKVAKLNNYTDNAAYWNEDFDMDNFEEEIQRLYQEILPFYKQLHAYVRDRLRKQLNTKQEQIIGNDGNLPAHVLGDIFAQEWQNIYNWTTPYPGKVSVDVTPALKAQRYTPLKMFKLAEQFYLSLNMSAMTKTFWKKSIIEKPKDGRDFVCAAAAWDFSNGDDYRIKMCTSVNYEYLKIITHEMGHVQYFMAYKDQPYLFEDGANSGFHEAVGDTMALSVATAKHLLKIGLLDPKTYKEDKQTDINNLYLVALEKVAFLPFAYVLDLWRWEIFQGKTPFEQYNCRFWQLRQSLEGIIPPIDRDEDDFDGGAKYHVVADVPYIRYFVSFILQFQFHKALCIKAGQYNPKQPDTNPLHKCDIYQSTEAGNLFKRMLSLGSSKPWEDALEVLTGGRKMDAGPLLEYFKPLYDWLVQENKRNGVKVGWSDNYKVSFCGKNKPDAGKNKGPCRYTFSDSNTDEDC